MEKQIIEHPEAVVIKLSGKLMGGTFMQDMSETLHKLLDEGKKNVVLDIGDVSMITSTGIGILISGYTTMKNASGDLKLASVTDRGKGLLQVTALDSIFKYYPSVEEALKSFSD
jgi:anti-sigma B factor antagonist